MAKEVPAFLRAEIGNTPTNPTPEPQNGMLGRLAQMRLQFAEGQLDEVEFRRILRLQLTFAAREEPPHRPPAACDPAFAHRRDDLGVPADSACCQRRGAAAAWLVGQHARGRAAQAVTSRKNKNCKK